MWDETLNVFLLAGDVAYTVTSVTAEAAVLPSVTRSPSVMDHIWRMACDCTNNARRNPSDCQVHTSVQGLMAESVTERLGLGSGQRPVAANGRLIARWQSMSHQSYRMLLLGYVSWDVSICRRRNLWLCFFNLHKRKNIVASAGVSHWLPVNAAATSLSSIWSSVPRGLIRLLLWQPKCQLLFHMSIWPSPVLFRPGKHLLINVPCRFCK